MNTAQQPFTSIRQQLVEASRVIDMGGGPLDMSVVLDYVLLCNPQRRASRWSPFDLCAASNTAKQINEAIRESKYHLDLEVRASNMSLTNSVAGTLSWTVYRHWPTGTIIAVIDMKTYPPPEGTIIGMNWSDVWLSGHVGDPTQHFLMENIGPAKQQPKPSLVGRWVRTLDRWFTKSKGAAA